MASTQRKTSADQFDRSTTGMPLERGNFIAMAIAGVLIVLGFILMLGSGSTMEEFNPDIFSTRRIVIGPAIAFIGFVAMGAAIIIDPKRLPFGKKK